MPTRRGTGQSTLQELQRVTALLHDEVVPRLHDGEPPGNGRPNGSGSGSGSTDPDQDSASATGALRTLADLYRELSPEAASALDQLFSTFDGHADTTIGVGAPGGIPTQPGVRVGPIGRLLVQILTHYPKRRELAISSGFRPGPRSYHRGLPYKGSPAAAIDVVAPGAGKMRDVAKWLYDHFANDTVELIHTTPFNSDHGFYVKNQVKYPGGGPYDPPTRRQHRNHVHFATSKALAQSVLKGMQKTSVGPMAMAAPTRAMGVTRAVGARTAGRLSKRGAQFIAGFEGLRNRLYNDPAGHCTIGIGHLVHRGRCNGGEPAEFKRGISNDQAFALLQHDARQMEGAVNRLGVPLNQNQFDALVSFTLQPGSGLDDGEDRPRRVDQSASLQSRAA